MLRALAAALFAASIATTANHDMNELNPVLVMERPASGRYDIWIGVLGGGSGISPRK